MKFKIEDIVRWNGNIMETGCVWRDLYKYLSTNEEYKIVNIDRSINDNMEYILLETRGSEYYYYPSKVFYKECCKQYISKKYGLK